MTKIRMEMESKILLGKPTKSFNLEYKLLFKSSFSLQLSLNPSCLRESFSSQANRSSPVSFKTT